MSVVSRYSVRIALTITALNKLDIMAFDIHNVYLAALCRENIWTFRGPEFGEEEGKLMLVKMTLYEIKSSGAVLRSKLAGVLRDIGYFPTKGDPNVRTRPEVKPDGTEYYGMVLCYVDDILEISATSMKTI